MRNEYISLCASKSPLQMLMYRVLVIEFLRASILSLSTSSGGVATIASLKSFLRADFVIQHHLSYSTFHFKGSYPFAALEGGVTLLTKGLHL